MELGAASATPAQPGKEQARVRAPVASSGGPHSSHLLPRLQSSFSPPPVAKGPRSRSSTTYTTGSTGCLDSRSTVTAIVHPSSIRSPPAVLTLRPLTFATATTFTTLTRITSSRSLHSRSFRRPLFNSHSPPKPTQIPGTVSLPFINLDFLPASKAILGCRPRSCQAISART